MLSLWNWEEWMLLFLLLEVSWQCYYLKIQLRIGEMREEVIHSACSSLRGLRAWCPEKTPWNYLALSNLPSCHIILCEVLQKRKEAQTSSMTLHSASKWLCMIEIQIQASWCGEKRTLLHCWWERKLVQPLWRTVWRFLKKLELPYDPAIPLLGIYLEKTLIQKYTCTPMFIVALFTIAKTWKQPKCPSTDEWIKKMWYIYTYTMKY